MAKPVRIPLTFYFDHKWRDLDTLELVKKTKRHGWIRADDPALPELISDAKFHADPYGPSEPPGIKRAPRALLHAIKRGLIERNEATKSS